jgi:hypothetical protein
MIPCDDLEKKFALRSGQPCLTFSALVNEAGALLDYSIEPGMVNHVIHTTHSAVSQVIPHLESKMPIPEEFSATLEVGEAPSRSQVPKHIRVAEDFSEQEREDLLALARVGRPWIRGPVRMDFQNLTNMLAPKATVSFDGVAPAPADRKHDWSTIWHGDPYIKVQHDAQDRDYLVEGAMILAGVVAARWCGERRIPIPYRTTSDAHQVELIKELLEKEMYPKLESGVPIDELPMSTLISLYGSGLLSLEPRPHAMMGLDMYAKATSPLRRFGDLLLHWQIHATLAEERRLGRSLKGEDCSEAEFLPFSRQDMGRMLLDLQDRESIFKLLNNRLGPQQWVRQALVRAWKFGEAPLPERIIFTARSPTGGTPTRNIGMMLAMTVLGTIDWFRQPAYMDHKLLNGVVESADVRDGDRFEVQIEDMNVADSRIRVKAIRRLGSQEQSPVA